MELQEKDNQTIDQAVEVSEDEGGIAPGNEITDLRLLLIHIGLCLCTFLVGLIRYPICASQSLAGKTFTLFPKKWTYLSAHVTWRWCFYIHLPIGAFSVTAFVLFFRIKPARTEEGATLQKLKALDGVGFSFFAGAVAMLLLALQLGGTSELYAWDSSRIIGMFVGSGATFIAFVSWQLYLQNAALIPPQLFRHRNTSLIFSSAVFSNGPFQCIVYWLPVWFQAVLEVSPTASGVRYLPTVIADVVTSIVGSVLVTYWGQ
ncbi:uncharacterized protein KD926_004993 [Aspergillus affinis]|uniref:uncharacterized protein n=1 Tax=Aspergillus affinis TaxID=1070780 RepID=UPI0022FEB854|nr:uncharacterized protein KD926_004993 [Aspergillus affinis]KAI9034945.1 hypothetical protein KD926_004993 [Aspergillus affinis]